MTSSLISLVAAVPPEHTRELPLPQLAFGLIAFACFLGLLAVLWSFRNAASGGSGTTHEQGEKH